MSNPTLLGIAAGLVLATNGSADIINVPVDFASIQAAIKASTDGDEIVVAPGTYNETFVFNLKAVTVRSSHGPEVTIIDGTGLDSRTIDCDRAPEEVGDTDEASALVVGVADRAP